MKTGRLQQGNHCSADGNNYQQHKIYSCISKRGQRNMYVTDKYGTFFLKVVQEYAINLYPILA